MKQVDWEKSLKDWKPSSDEAIPLTEETQITQVAGFCKYVGDHCWDSIEYFERVALTSKQNIEKDGLSKNSVFLLAAEQILQHRKVWKVKQQKRPNCLTYEFPLAVTVDNQLRYMKFQINEGVNGLASPNKVKRIGLRYHPSDLLIEVIYV